jgi:hypothetical protein
MRTLGVLLKYKLYELRNYSRTPRRLLLWLPPLAVAAVAFYFVHRWLTANPGYAPLVLLSCILLFLIISLLNGFYGLFAGRENSLLLAAPVSFPVFLAVRYLDRLPRDMEYTLPLGLAAALVLGSLHGYLPVLLVLFLGVAVTGILGYLLIILTAYLCGNHIQIVLSLISLAVLALPAFLMKRLQGLVMTSQLPVAASLLALAALLLLMLLVATGGSRLGSLYFSALGRMQGGKRHGPRLAGRLGYRLIGVFNNPTGALIVKDYLSHVRTMMQWVRVFLLIIAAGLYFLFKGRLLPPGLLAMPFLNVAVVLVLTHFVTNEIPAAAFAAEANRIKLLLAAPVSAGRVVLAKYISYGLPVLIMGLLCIIVLGVGSGSVAGDLWRSALIGVAMLFGVTAALVGLGAAGALPDKEVDGYVDQLMVEQTAASSPQSLLAYGAGTVVMIVDIAAIAGIDRLSSGTGQGLILVLAVACLNLLLGLASLIFGARWLRAGLGV